MTRLAILLALTLALALSAPDRARAQQDEPEVDDTATVEGHPVYIFEFSDAGFAPSSLRTGPGTSAIFIRNLTMSARRFTVTRRRAGKKKLLFSGEPIAGQSITGTTKFRSGDVFIVKETNSGHQVKIFVE